MGNYDRLGFLYIAKDLTLNSKVLLREYLPETIAVRGRRGISVEPIEPQEFKHNLENLKMWVQSLEIHLDIGVLHLLKIFLRIMELSTTL